AHRTVLEDFEAFELLAGDEILRRHAGTGTGIGGALEERRLDFVPLCTAGAWPAGRVAAKALATLFDRLEGELRAAGPLDCLLFELHGAMVSEDADDVEAEALSLVRQALDERPVVAVFDLHGNPSPELATLVDGAVAYDTYPHVDMRARGREAAAMLAAMLEGSRLRTLLRKVRLLSTPLAQATDQAPMRALRDLARRLARRPGIARISLLPGFPYSDVARAGFSVLVTATREAEDEAAEAAGEVIAEVEARAVEFELRRPGPAEAVGQALEAIRRPVVLVDVADNVGGGSAGDGTAPLAG